VRRCSIGLGETGATKVAIHVDVDTIDADEIRLGLGADLGGLNSAEARRVVADVYGLAEIVALTIAEFIARQRCTCSSFWPGFHCSVREPEQTPHDRVCACRACPAISRCSSILATNSRIDLLDRCLLERLTSRS
jgi:hypothetical protein